MQIVPILNRAIRVLVVDRDSMSGDLLANALIRDRRCEAHSIKSVNLMQAMSTADVDLAVIASDLNSEQGSGFDLAHRVSRSYPDMSFVILLNSSSDAMVIRAFRAGARGVFSRQQPMAEFLDCIDQVSKGFIWAGRQETNSLLEALQRIPVLNSVLAIDSPTLTARELQVVQLASTGKTNKAIAGELALSAHTVKNYLFRAFEKLGVSSRVELLFYLTTRCHNCERPTIECGNSVESA